MPSSRRMIQEITRPTIAAARSDLSVLASTSSRSFLRLVFWLMVLLAFSFIMETTEGWLLAPMIPHNHYNERRACSRPLFQSRGSGSTTEEQEQTVTRSRSSTPTPAAQSETTQSRKIENTRETALSDVDARVLQSMLRDKKLNLETEDDVRKLLERGTVKTVVPPKKKQEAVDSNYSSQMLQTLTDTKLWRRVSAQARDAAASVGLWVANKVENDVQVLAALGLFAWDRAVRDVARALPASSSAASKGWSMPLQLTNSSSFTKSQQQRPIKEQLNRPADELKEVSQQVLGILKGDSTSTQGGRGLRTAAPAGRAYAAERQTRAYKQSKKQRQRQNDVTQQIRSGSGAIADTAAELKRELKAETNRPGYKTQPLRQALQEAASVSGTLLEAARQEARLAAAQRRELRQLQQQQTPGTNDNNGSVNGSSNAVAAVEEVVDSVEEAGVAATPAATRDEDPKQRQLLDDLQREGARVRQRLKRCIDAPNETWLTSTVAAAQKEDIRAGLQDAVTRLILLKLELEEEVQDGANTVFANVEAAVAHLKTVRDRVEDLCERVDNNMSGAAAAQLRRELLGEPAAFFAQPPLILRLDELAIVADKKIAAEPESDGIKAAAAETPESLGIFGWQRLDTDDVDDADCDDDVFSAAHQVTIAAEESKTSPSDAFPSTGEAFQTQVGMPASAAAKVEPAYLDVDVIVGEVNPDTVVMESNHNAEPHSATIFVDDGIDAAGAGLIAEIVTDDDFDRAFGEAKVAVEVNEAEEEKEDSILVQVLLRSLDVTFFLLEKILAGIPGAIERSQTALTRFAEVNRDGRGTKGWKPVKNLADTKGRY